MSCVPESSCCCLFIPSISSFFFLSNFQILKCFVTLFQELWSLEDWNLVYTWTVGRCIVYSGIRLLLHICLFISSFFFLSNFQTLKCFITLFSGTVRPRMLKLGTIVDSGQMYHVYWNQAAAAYLSLYLVFFLSNFQTLKYFVTLFSGTLRPRRLTLSTHVNSGQMYCVYQNRAAAAYWSLYFFSYLSLQFSSIKKFCHTFLRNCEAYKVDTWYTHGQWVAVSCIPESGCCFLFVPYFFLSNIQKFIIFVTLFSGTWYTVDSGWMYHVYQNRAAAAYLSLYFFILLSLQLSNINIFHHIFLRNCEA